jgi:arylformamidase
VKHVIYLSHVLSQKTTGYGGKKGFIFEIVSSQAQGDSSNSSRWIFHNHIGTHIDVPYHFSEKGLKLDSYEASFWYFESPYFIDYPTQAGDLIAPGLWSENIPLEADLLLIRTGFEAYRQKELYWQNNPGLSGELGVWLRENRPKLRAIGLDAISATCYQKRAEGKRAHLAFLSSEVKGNPILIIEDMSLYALKVSPHRVIMTPLIVEGADGGPVTVLAEIDHE